MAAKWQFWIDRGGTFTDVVAKRPDGQFAIRKVLSDDAGAVQDAPVRGIRQLMDVPPERPLSARDIDTIKMGTTIATNALLERTGERTVLAITRGFRDALRIGYQHRPDIFARRITRPEQLQARTIEVDERLDAAGNVRVPLDRDSVRQALQAARDAGIRSCAIALVHGYRYPKHEQAVAEIARQVGFEHVSASHAVNPLMKLVSRADTTVVDAYLSPLLQRYVHRVASQLAGYRAGEAAGEGEAAAIRILFMQSHGGLTDARAFRGKDSILSGPAGGIVGAVKTSAIAGFDRIISFDMGGTSTDVAHYAGEYERDYETEIAGVRLQAPMMAIHTVAAGGGSIARFDGLRYRVGPQSAGADPGPAAYGKGGPLTVTDCNVMAGKLRPEFFPHAFGPNGDAPLDAGAVRERFARLREQIGDGRPPEAIASGFLAIAVETMASAIEQISLARGYDASQYALCCFGGAGGQHACAIADALGIERVLIHPYAGVLSAYGIGLADIRVLREEAVEAPLHEGLIAQLEERLEALIADGRAELDAQAAADSAAATVRRQVRVRYEGTNSPLSVAFNGAAAMRQQFETAHRQRYGFAAPEKALVVEAIAIELVCPTETPEEAAAAPQRQGPPQPLKTVPVYTAGAWHQAPLYARDRLQPGDRLVGPALAIEATGTNVIEPGWVAEVTPQAHLLLKRQRERAGQPQLAQAQPGTVPDPVALEIFNNAFRSVAERMGATLRNTSYSVNIKERLDFSCALFDGNGQLVANAPHIPVHLGSMSASVRSLIAACGDRLQPGDAYALNNPYNGGTHLPDVTVVTPVFLNQNQPAFYLASRGHHADIGGMTPGSMPPNSTHVEQEGILLDNVRLLAQGRLREREFRELLAAGAHPARNPQQNLADLQAQLAANERGIRELQRLVEQFGLATVQAYMGHVQANAEASVRRAIEALRPGRFRCELDGGACIEVAIDIDRHSRSARIDFAGTSAQQASNFNAPAAVCQAAVLYVFRTLVEDDIPLNEGCLKPLEIAIPAGSLLNPDPPAAVVAGNVETSQTVVDALYGALGVMAAAQGTMNNLTFGSARYQYYETIGGGSGAGPDFDGTDAVQTHMTNSRLTDPEVLEWRFPVLLEHFGIRPQSGGRGRHCGGNGAIRRIQFLEAMEAGILSGRRQIAPFGLYGGEAGATGQNRLERSDGTSAILGSTATVAVAPGDAIIIATPGGGGYGDPSEATSQGAQP
ncbi:MAG: 5-oxoprolinase [Cyanobacteria bacterium QS_8_64_29]|nr:MAG: 5-oxoprolinase [Cyanobacteria bacterium QS_8_64_29]